MVTWRKHRGRCPLKALCCSSQGVEKEECGTVTNYLHHVGMRGFFSSEKRTFEALSYTIFLCSRACAGKEMPSY